LAEVDVQWTYRGRNGFGG